MIAGALVVSLALGLAGANAALDKCRALDKEFDTKNMPKPCQAAADDATLSVVERVEALRLLAFAHILNGDDALAEPAFLRMLVFSPSADLPADAGPKFRDVFARVKQRFEKDGKVDVAFTPPVVVGSEPAEVKVDVTDKLGRVVGARLRAQTSANDAASAPSAPLEERLVRNELGPGQVRFTGRVPEAKDASGAPVEGTVSYEVFLDGWDGQPVKTSTPISGQLTRGSATASTGDGGEGGEFPWATIGIASGIGVVAAGLVAGGVALCFLGPCRHQEAWVRVQVQQVGE